jgi:hypothetical protein
MAIEGWGLWLSRQICDLVEVRTNEGGTVRAASRRDGLSAVPA